MKHKPGITIHKVHSAPSVSSYIHTPLTTHHSMYPLQNIALSVLDIVEKQGVKLPHIHHTVLRNMAQSTRDRPYGRIPYALVFQSMDIIARSTGTSTWFLTRYLPNIYFPMEKFLHTAHEVHTKQPIHIYLEVPLKKTPETYTDSDIVLSLLAMTNFAVKKTYLKELPYKHLFDDGEGPYAVAKDVNTIYGLMHMAKPHHIYKALSIIDKPNFLSGLIASHLPEEEKLRYIKAILNRYICKENYFLTAYHLIESTLDTDEILKDREILRYAILALGYTRLIGTYGKTILENIDSLNLQDPLLLMLLTVILENLSIKEHTTLSKKLWEAYDKHTGKEQTYAAYGIINMAYFTRHTADISHLLKKHPIPEDIPLHIRAHLLRIHAKYMGSKISIKHAIDNLKSVIDDISDKEGFLSFKGELLRSLADLLSQSGDTPPYTPLTMYWQSIPMDLMHSSIAFGKWIITAPHAGIPYSTVAYTFHSIIDTLRGIFRNKEIVHLYGAMAEACLIYGHIYDYYKYMHTVEKAINHLGIYEQNIYFIIKLHFYILKERWKDAKDILDAWEKEGVLMTFIHIWQVAKQVIDIVMKSTYHDIHTYDSSQPYLIYILGKYTNRYKWAISNLNKLLRHYTSTEDPILRAEIYTYLYRLGNLQGTDRSKLTEYALAARFIYEELGGKAPPDIGEVGKTKKNLDPYMKLLGKRYRQKSKLLQILLSAIGSMDKEEVMALLLRGLGIPFTTAYGRYESKDQTIEAIFSYVGVKRKEELGKIDTSSDKITSHPSTITTVYHLENKKLTLYAEHRYAENIYTEETLSEMRHFAGEIIAILDSLSIVEKARFDSLTGLYSRWFLTGEAPRMWKRTILDGGPISLIFIDIDDFKQVNDSYGHMEGDKVLKEVANIIQSNIRISDSAVRYGGDEFLIILPYATSDTSLLVANRIVSDIKKHSLLRKYGITLSIGIYTAHSKDTDMDQAIALADKAMYTAKHHGKNRIFVYS